MSMTVKHRRAVVDQHEEVIDETYRIGRRVERCFRRMSVTLVEREVGIGDHRDPEGYARTVTTSAGGGGNSGSGTDSPPSANLSNWSGTAAG